jgi:hypothetical protein
LTPVNNTNETTNTTANTQSNNNIVTNAYRISTAIVSGAVISILMVFFLKSSKIETLKNQTSAGPNK